MLSLLRKPDAVYGATEASDFRFEENLTNDVKYEYVVEGNSAKVIVHPSGSPVKYLKLRFRGDLEGVDKVLGDQWERVGYGNLTSYLEWRTIMPNRIMPWFCYVLKDGQMSCYGVKTGADAFVSFQVDFDGITLFLNLCNGNDGTDLQAPLVACEVVEYFAEKGADPYKTAQTFAKQMCDAPVLPKEPIFGVNNWYWAYGQISHDIVTQEVRQLMHVASGCKHRPYVIIDDGWQKYREEIVKGENPGAPWVPNSRFPSMKDTADTVHNLGAKIGVWIRPLLSKEKGEFPDEAINRIVGSDYYLDPSHPIVLQYVEDLTKKITKEWGFDLIKHDFTTIDATGVFNMTAEHYDYKMCVDGIRFYDKTKTTATILKNLYKALQKGAGDKDMIACNTISHLTAGVHSIYRTGNDTSGRAFEWTRRDGVNCVMRLPLNEAFYNADPDCAPFTERVPFEANLQFLEMCAITGMTTLASIKLGFLTDEQMQQINAVFRIADENKLRYQIANYDKTSNPETFVSPDGKDRKRYHWSNTYDGSRIVLDWFN